MVPPYGSCRSLGGIKGSSRETLAWSVAPCCGHPSAPALRTLFASSSMTWATFSDAERLLRLTRQSSAWRSRIWVCSPAMAQSLFAKQLADIEQALPPPGSLWQDLADARVPGGGEAPMYVAATNPQFCPLPGFFCVDLGIHTTCHGTLGLVWGAPLSETFMYEVRL